MTTVPFVVTSLNGIEIRVIDDAAPNDFQAWPINRKYALYLARELIRAVQETEARVAGE